MRKKAGNKAARASACGLVFIALLAIPAGVLAQAAPSSPSTQMTSRLYPKNLAQPLIGTRIRVDATSGFHLGAGSPAPTNGAGTLDASTFIGEDFSGLSLAPGNHTFTVILKSPQVIDRVAFLNATAEGTFTVTMSGSDPQLLGPPATAPTETRLAGPDMVNYAIFQPQTAQFIKVDFKISRAGRLARLSAFGQTSDLDYALKIVEQTPPPAPAATPPAPAAGGSGSAASSPAAPPAAPPKPSAPTKSVQVNVAGLSSGARVVGVSSSKPGSDPAMMISDSLGSTFGFNPADPSPSVDIDLKAPRKAASASIFMSAPPGRVELIRIPPPGGAGAGGAPPAATFTRADGVVETVNLDGSDKQPVKKGDVLVPGRAIQTGFNSGAEFDLGGKALVRVGPNSNVVFRVAQNVEVRILRGTALWQVYAPGGGGDLVTPTTVCTLTGTTVAADVKLNGATKVNLLETGKANGVQIRSVATGELYSLHPGESASLSSDSKAPMTVEPFVVQNFWNASPVGSPAGGLKNGMETAFGPGGTPPPAESDGEVLATAQSTGGLTEVKLPITGDQTIQAVRIKVTPLPGLPPEQNTPVTIVKLGVYGTYNVQDLDVTFKGQSLASLSTPVAPETPAAPAPSAPEEKPADVTPPEKALAATAVTPEAAPASSQSNRFFFQSMPLFDQIGSSIVAIDVPLPTPPHLPAISP